MGQVFQQFSDFLESLGLNTSGIVGLVATLWILKEFGIFSFLKKGFLRILGWFRQYLQSSSDRDFIYFRKRFVQQLIYEIERQNREDDWNDFHYVNLEAEVEVEDFAEVGERTGINISFFSRLLKFIYRLLTGTIQQRKIARNLITAITNSNSRVFLVIGDPGTGKTVSMRHLALQMARETEKSKRRNALIPLYFNLKRFNIKLKTPDAESVQRWVIEQLVLGQDRTTHQFVLNNFDKLLGSGSLFFIFDSFDELPGVIDAREQEHETQIYAETFDRFLHSAHGCGGIVASRPYRAPKIFIGERLLIRPLSDVKIKEAIFNYLFQDRNQAKALVNELFIRRDDLLIFVRNPFYLNLLVNFTKNTGTYPERQFDLFDHFIKTRFIEDAARIKAYGFTPEEIVSAAGRLGYAMFNSPDIALELNLSVVPDVSKIMGTGWDANRVISLLSALRYSKMGKISEEIGSGLFSFAHRRFHEYFCAVFLQQNPLLLPIREIIKENRWREVLVLLCEVLPEGQLDDIFREVALVLQKGNNDELEQDDQRDVIETLRFLKDGFKSRIRSVPNELRILAEKIILKQLTLGNLLNRKRALECALLATSATLPSIINEALTSKSPWLQETAFRASRLLTFLDEKIEILLRRYLYRMYSDFSIFREFNNYLILLSAPPILARLQRYLIFLRWFAILQLAALIAATLLLIANGVAGPEIISVILVTGFLTGLLMSSDVTKKRAEFKYSFMDNPFFYSFSYLLIYVYLRGYSNYISPGLLLTFSYLSNIAVHNSIMEYPQDIYGWISLPLRGLLMILKAFIKLFVGIPKFLYQLPTRLFTDYKKVLLTIVIIGYLIWAIPSVTLLRENGYSIPALLATSGIWLGLATLLGSLPIILLLVIILVGLVIGVFISIMDVVRLVRYLYFEKTMSMENMVKKIGKFNGDNFKVMFIRSIRGQTSFPEGIKILVEVASKQSSIVADEIYKLIELWEDAEKS